MDLKEIGFENEKWIELAGCSIEWYCTALSGWAAWVVWPFNSASCTIGRTEGLLLSEKFNKTGNVHNT
jgi:hypothetical protein